MKHKIAVIGAGTPGISALKNLLDQELNVVAFDRNTEVGGNWIHSENESHSSVFETPHIISSKTLSQYEDFTFDDFDPEISDYCSHDELIRYFHPIGCIWPGIELQSKLLVQELFGKWKRPSNIQENCDKEIPHPYYRQINTPSDTITIDDHLFVKALKMEVPNQNVSKSPILEPKSSTTAH